MNTPAHDFVTVDMRGLKAALVARARENRVSVSTLVRAAVARDLGVASAAESSEVDAVRQTGQSAVKLSIRVSTDEAARFACAARAAGLSRSAFLSGLVSGVPVLTSSSNRTEHLAAVIASNAELATLGRNMRDLIAMLRRGESHAAEPYRDRLESLDGEFRRHLALVSRTLAELRPRSGTASTRSVPRTREHTCPT